MSGVDVDGRSVRKGAAGAVLADVASQGGATPAAVSATIDAIAAAGGTPLVVCDGDEVLGVVHLKDVVKVGIRERFDELRRMGIRTVMITGDNPMTAKAIADRGRCRRLPGRSHARGQDGADQARAGGRSPRRDDG